MLEKGQDSALLRFSLGNEYQACGDLDAATGHLEKAVELDSGYSAAWKLLGRVLAENGRADEATDVYEKGIAVAGASGDHQAAKEMSAFLRRLKKSSRAGE